MEGVVVKVLAGVITVNTPNGLINCTVKGRLKLDDYPTAGDVVWVEVIDDLGVVTKIYPRRNLLDRPRIANVDQIFIFMRGISRILMPTLWIASLVIAAVLEARGH